MPRARTIGHTAGSAKRSSALTGSHEGPSIEQLIARKVTVDERTGCWVYGNDRDVYGVVRAYGKRWRAHRLVFRLCHGDDPPDGYVVHHECHTPACVNPRHLVAMPAEAHASMHAAERRSS